MLVGELVDVGGVHFGRFAVEGKLGEEVAKGSAVGEALLVVIWAELLRGLVAGRDDAVHAAVDMICDVTDLLVEN